VDTAPASSAGSPEAGYSRAAVDDFLAAAAEERRRLEDVIAEAEFREQRARSTVEAHFGLHDAMVKALLETQHELGFRRREAEEQAARILEQADLEARAVIDSARAEVSARSGGPSIEPPFVDLAAEERPEPAEPGDVSWMSPTYVDHRRGGTGAIGAQPETTKESDAYFDYLRGALVDERPLGPRAD
jgi:hypothetical protein